MVSRNLTYRATNICHAFRPAGPASALQFDSGGFSANPGLRTGFEAGQRRRLRTSYRGFGDLRVYLSYEIETGKRLTEVYLRGRNLTGDEQRKHTSIIKDLAPDPDRTIEVGVRFRF